MKIIKASFQVETDLDREKILLQLEKIIRTCYRSECKDGAGTLTAAIGLIKRCIDSKHESVLEHVVIPVRFKIDRALANELIRHRFLAISQESTRFVNYGKKGGVEFVMPGWMTSAHEQEWTYQMIRAEASYLSMVRTGAKPEVARSVLPLCTATEIVITTNLRAWRNILKIRTAKEVHPDLRSLMKQLAESFHQMLPEVFDQSDGKAKKGQENTCSVSENSMSQLESLPLPAGF